MESGSLQAIKKPLTDVGPAISKKQKEMILSYIEAVVNKRGQPLFAVERKLR
jgi:acyl-CoA reductase-like NAD-dependent aldehyde dehydrogenase